MNKTFVVVRTTLNPKRPESKVRSLISGSYSIAKRKRVVTNSLPGVVKGELVLTDYSLQCDAFLGS